jgi:hypothetical protein
MLFHRVRLSVALPATSPSTCATSVTPCGDCVAASVALQVITTHKYHHHVQAVTQRDTLYKTN